MVGPEMFAPSARSFWMQTPILPDLWSSTAAETKQNKNAIRVFRWWSPQASPWPPRPTHRLFFFDFHVWAPKKNLGSADMDHLHSTLFRFLQIRTFISQRKIKSKPDSWQETRSLLGAQVWLTCVTFENKVREWTELEVCGFSFIEFTNERCH